MLTIPVMAVVDMVVQGQVLAWNVFVGGGAILVGFFILTFAELRDTVDKAGTDESDADADADADINADADADAGADADADALAVAVAESESRQQVAPADTQPSR
ncbi:hypothetical protein LPJ57_010476 [Coemansia sp. RSA 486]|nr:hypothetical protein LPJ57_010476 [Coemansia sp. RSA 486]